MKKSIGIILFFVCSLQSYAQLKNIFYKKNQFTDVVITLNNNQVMTGMLKDFS